MKGPRILLVDDDLDERFLGNRALKKALPSNATINLAASGNEAIAYMVGDGKFGARDLYPFPSLIITDLNMEDGDGFDVLEFMKVNPSWSVVPRIVFSSSDDDDDVRTAFLLGASAYHLKPNQSGELDLRMTQIVAYWATSQVPPVDEAGRLLPTKSAGRRGARYPQPKSEQKMKRPGRRERPE